MGMHLPLPYLAIDRAIVSWSLILPLDVSTIGQVNPAISHALKPALKLASIMTLLRVPCLSEAAYVFKRRNSAASTNLAGCLAIALSCDFGDFTLNQR